MKRRNFIGLCMAGSAALLTENGCKPEHPVYRGKITGASAEIGHLLRDLKTNPVPATYQSVHTVIAGAGVSGLSAGRWLQKNGRNDFLILELEDHAGGNAAYGKNEMSAYPCGAHYIPTPNNQLTRYKNISYYLPLTDKDAAAARKAAYKNTYNDWCRIAVSDLKKAHPEIEEYLEEINITVWGHSMPKPLPGHIFGEFRQVLQQPVDNKIFFAHTDYAGISIFEEGFYQGIQAVEKIVHAG